MKSVYFVRHGQTVWNVENKICGATDIELTALDMSRRLRQERRFLEKKIEADVILYSPAGAGERYRITYFRNNRDSGKRGNALKGAEFRKVRIDSKRWCQVS